VHESGYRTPCCLSDSEFRAFPLTCARRGKFRCKAEPRNAKGVFSWGYPFFGQAKKGYKKSYSTFFRSLSQPIWADSYSPLLGQRAKRSSLSGLTQSAQQLGLRLSSRRAQTRGRQEFVLLLAKLRQLAVLIPRPQPSLGCAATGLKTNDIKPESRKLTYSSSSPPPSNARVYLHDLFGHFIRRPQRLVVFSTRNGDSHFGQCSSMGLSQLANEHFGYIVQL